MRPRGERERSPGTVARERARRSRRRSLALRRASRDAQNDERHESPQNRTTRVASAQFIRYTPQRAKMSATYLLDQYTVVARQLDAKDRCARASTMLLTSADASPNSRRPWPRVGRAPLQPNSRSMATTRRRGLTSSGAIARRKSANRRCSSVSLGWRRSSQGAISLSSIRSDSIRRCVIKRHSERRSAAPVALSLTLSKASTSDRRAEVLSTEKAAVVGDVDMVDAEPASSHLSAQPPDSLSLLPAAAIAGDKLKVGVGFAGIFVKSDGTLSARDPITAMLTDAVQDADAAEAKPPLVAVVREKAPTLMQEWTTRTTRNGGHGKARSPAAVSSGSRKRSSRPSSTALISWQANAGPAPEAAHDMVALSAVSHWFQGCFALHVHRVATSELALTAGGGARITRIARWTAVGTCRPADCPAASCGASQAPASQAPADPAKPSWDAFSLADSESSLLCGRCDRRSSQLALAGPIRLRGDAGWTAEHAAAHHRRGEGRRPCRSPRRCDAVLLPLTDTSSQCPGPSTIAHEVRLRTDSVGGQRQMQWANCIVRSALRLRLPSGMLDNPLCCGSVSRIHVDRLPRRFALRPRPSRLNLARVASALTFSLLPSMGEICSCFSRKPDRPSLWLPAASSAPARASRCASCLALSSASVLAPAQADVQRHALERRARRPRRDPVLVGLRATAATAAIL